eukprot:SM000281S10760  [mRNA]  locus=s281:7945:19463:- [translate_table: standard]
MQGVVMEAGYKQSADGQVHTRRADLVAVPPGGGPRSIAFGVTTDCVNSANLPRPASTAGHAVGLAARGKERIAGWIFSSGMPGRPSAGDRAQVFRTRLAVSFQRWGATDAADVLARSRRDDATAMSWRLRPHPSFLNGAVGLGRATGTLAAVSEPNTHDFSATHRRTVHTLSARAVAAALGRPATTPTPCIPTGEGEHDGAGGHGSRLATAAYTLPPPVAVPAPAPCCLTRHVSGLRRSQLKVESTLPSLVKTSSESDI